MEALNTRQSQETDRDSEQAGDNYGTHTKSGRQRDQQSIQLSYSSLQLIHFTQDSVQKCNASVYHTPTYNRRVRKSRKSSQWALRHLRGEMMATAISTRSSLRLAIFVLKEAELHLSDRNQS